MIKIKNPKKIKNVILTDNAVTFEDIVAVSRYEATVSFSDEFINRVVTSNNLINKFVDNDKIIYGVTTGFGKNVEYVINKDEAVKLQNNIVRSHSASVGNPLEIEVSRALLMMFLVNTGKGFSGISLETLTLIKDMLNKKVTPYAPSEGSVGYLAVEGYFAMVLIGEGKAWVNGKLKNGKEALKAKNLKPISLSYKEGLSLLNGSMSVCAFSALAIYDLIIAAKNLDISASLNYEALRGTIKAFDKELHSMKAHKEQNQSAELFRNILKDSEIMNKNIDSKVQDAYSLRCTSQIHGSAYSIIKDAINAINNEINSVSDNPVIIPDNGIDKAKALMGGNFDGSYISIYCDSACLGACMLGKLADKRVDRLVTSDLSGFPPFLVKKPGLNNGYMIPQYTVSGLFSEISNLSSPVSVQSISTCARQEEPVSLAYLAGKKLKKIAKKLQYIAAIEIMMAVQGIDFLKPLKPSPINAKIYNKIRSEVPELEEDRFYGDDIENIYNLVKNEELIDIVERIL